MALFYEERNSSLNSRTNIGFSYNDYLGVFCNSSQWSTMAVDFVKDWSIIQTLGEGAYGEVKLLVNKQSGELVAMKIIDLAKNPQAKEYVLKEVTIHKMLRNPQIIRYYGRRQHSDIEYIFLEYAPHGELFDRIEPDIGMSKWEAQKYMKQLIKGVEYLHSRGVAHRDLKPENLLLDENDNLKISDFGMATVFRVKDKERALDKRCGTLPYIAPEVLIRPYAAEPADIWSCGIVLVAMLAGELPWDKAELDCPDFAAWKKGQYVKSPWTKIDNLALSLLRKILYYLPSARLTIPQIRDHRWMTMNFKRRLELLSTQDADIEERSAKRMNSELNVSGDCECIDQNLKMFQSQPVASVLSTPSAKINMEPTAFSFSQPTHINDMLISTQQLNTQTPSTQNSLQKLVRRMTRFFVNVCVEKASEHLVAVLEKLKLSWKINSVGCVTISTVDKRKSILVFKANILEMDGKTLIDFRLSKGCGLEFKRYFISIRSCLVSLIVPIALTI